MFYKTILSKHFFVVNFFRWYFVKYNFFFIQNLFDYNHNFFLFIENTKFNYFSTDVSVSKELYKKAVLPHFKKRDFFFFSLLSNTKQLHWVYQNYDIVPRFDTVLKADLFFLKSFSNVLNLTYHLLLNNLNFFFTPCDYFDQELSSFHKYIYGVKNYWFLNYTSNFFIKNLRTFSFKYEIFSFIDSKKVKLLIFLAETNNGFYLQFLKKQNVSVFGLVSLDMTPVFFDYWIITKRNDFLIQYWVISCFFTMYNLVKYNKQLLLLKQYRFFFLKVL